MFVTKLLFRDTQYLIVSFQFFENVKSQKSLYKLSVVTMFCIFSNIFVTVKLILS